MLEEKDVLELKHLVMCPAAPGGLTLSLQSVDAALAHGGLQQLQSFCPDDSPNGTPETWLKKRTFSSESLDFGGAFGAIVSDWGPSRPRHATREGLLASRFFHESSVAPLGPRGPAGGASESGGRRSAGR